MQRYWLPVLRSGVASLMLVAGAAQAETTLRFATALPEGAGLMTAVYQPWVDELNARAEGVFKVMPYPPPFATGTNVWERTQQGIADMGLVVMPATGLPFAGTMVTTLPGTGSDLRAATSALWRLYQEGMLTDEYDSVHLMSLTATPPMLLTSTQEIRERGQLDGMKVRVNDANGAAALSALGAVPVALPFSEAYQAFSRGVVAGGVANSVTLVDFKFSDVVNHHIANVEFGFPPSGIVMNKRVYDGLSEEAKTILAEFSGIEGSLDIASRQYAHQTMNIDLLEARDDYTIVTLPGETEQEWKGIISKVADDWAQATPDGEAILARFRAAYDEAAEQAE